MAFILPIFPEGSLSSSVVTTVWVGVFVLVLFNLRFGWTLSGLVIPGYLVPLLMIKPLAAAVVCAEGMLTYFLVWYFSQYLSRYGKWSNFFGRDRFFALVLCSILIRVALDGYMFPQFARLVTAPWLSELDLSNNLHSFGLIIVSLIANQFWKPGFRRGLMPLVVTVGITYLLVRYPLMHFTNFSIGSLEFMYEDISARVLASPKAYIILVTTAFIASRLNLYYSWDFNGILIPSLLALQWYEPLRVLTSFTEALAIYFTASWVLKLSFLQETTVEGGRKVLLFFNLSFAYKMILGHVLVRMDPTLRVVDCFGFGYLLPSLIALKMHDKGIPERLTRTTLQASITGAVAASLIGFGLVALPQQWVWPLSTSPALAEESAAGEKRRLVEQLREDKIFLYEQRLVTTPSIPMQTELDAFSMGLRDLRAFLMEGDRALLSQARGWLAKANFSVVELEGGLWYLKELPPRHGWGLYVLARTPAAIPGSMVVEVPAPLDEWGTLESGAYFFQLFAGSALAISTSQSNPAGLTDGQGLATQRTFFGTFHRLFARKDVLQVRSYSTGSARILYGISTQPGTLEPPDLPSSLWVQSELPSSLRLSELKKLLNDIRIEWNPAPLRNFQRETTSSGFLELFLNREDRKRLLARFLLGMERIPSQPGPSGSSAPASGLSKDVSLKEWLLASKADIAPRGSNLYSPPSQEALLFLDEEVLTPLLHLVLKSRDDAVSQQQELTEIEAVHAAAISVNYQLLRHQDQDSKEEYLILTENPAHSPRRYWGTYVFRCGKLKPYAVEIPRPVFERHTLEYGLSLFEKLNAGFLLIAGSNPKCNLDGTSDIVQVDNKRSLFNLVNQVVLREAEGTPLLAIHIRAFGHKPGVALPGSDALLAWANGAADFKALSPLGQGLVSALEEDQLTLKFVDGSLETVGYEAQGSAQAQYLLHTRNKEFAALWLSPYTRIGYRQDTESLLQQAQFAALKISTTEESLSERLLAEKFVEPSFVVPQALLRVVDTYQHTHDVNALRAIQHQWREYQLRRVIDKNTQKSFLLLSKEDLLLPVVANLSFNPILLMNPERRTDFRVSTPLRAEDVKRYAESSAPILIIDQAP